MPKIPQHKTPRGTWCRFSGCDSTSGICRMCEPVQILDARAGGVDHACRGCWQYAGLNYGGHEIYRCDADKHVIISAHVSADHQCAAVCAETGTV